MAPQRVGELGRLLRPPRRILLEALEDDVLQLFPNVRPDRARGLRDFVDDPVEDRLNLSGEGRLPVRHS